MVKNKQLKYNYLPSVVGALGGVPLTQHSDPTSPPPQFGRSTWDPQDILTHPFMDPLEFLFLIDLYWSIIASQYCVCCTTKRIRHMHTHVPHIPSPPPSLSHPSRSSQSTEPISLCYAAAFHQLISKNVHYRFK